MKKNIPRRRRLDVDVEELDRIIDDAKTAPLSEADSQKLKTALHALAENLLPQRNTEKTSSVFGDAGKAAFEDMPAEADQPSGHGRNGAAAYRGAEKVPITHAKLAHGDRCPDCARGNVYRQKEPEALVRIAGKRRWRPPCTNWNGYAATPAGRSSRRRNRRAWVRRSTTKRPRR